MSASRSPFGGSVAFAPDPMMETTEAQTRAEKLGKRLLEIAYRTYPRVGPRRMGLERMRDARLAEEIAIEKDRIVILLNEDAVRRGAASDACAYGECTRCDRVSRRGGTCDHSCHWDPVAISVAEYRRRIR